jgi:hypothetical protein
MDLAMVAVYLPASARNILAHGKKHITEMMFKHSPFAHKINVERLQHQLRICRFGLFNELLALEPYTNSVLIDTLDFLDYNLKVSRFNPVFPIICIVTTIVNMLYVYRYGKTGKYARTIIYSSTFVPNDRIRTMSWSDNGLLLYIITELETKYSLYIYRFDCKKYKMSLVVQLPFVDRLLSDYLWLDNNSLLYSSPDKPSTHMCRLTINKGNLLHKQPVGNIFDLEFLNRFTNLSSPIVVLHLPNIIFFTGNVRCRNAENGKYTNQSCLIQVPIFDPTRITLYHVPGPMFNIASNGRFLVFTYEAQSTHTSEVHCHEITPDQSYIDCASHYNPSCSYNILVVGILDTKLTLDYRILNRE